MPGRCAPAPGYTKARLMTVRASWVAVDTCLYQTLLRGLLFPEMTARAEPPECRGKRPRRLVRSRHIRRGERALPDAGQLVRAAAGGDQGAWNQLVERFTGLVWSVARAHRLGAA